MDSFAARYRSLCNPCGEDIKPGEYIKMHPDVGAVHEECFEDVGKAPQTDSYGREPGYNVPDTMPRGKTASDRCGKCFQIPSTNGSCGCY